MGPHGIKALIQFNDKVFNLLKEGVVDSVQVLPKANNPVDNKGH